MRRHAERGWVTAEMAFAMAGIGTALVMCAGVFAMLIAQIQCGDVAGEIARQAARGDLVAVRELTETLPEGSGVDMGQDGSDVMVTVTRTIRPWGPILPAWTLEAQARAACEGA